ncbi:MAG: hypothetical protein V7735_21385 [Photobacterium frigidiphilum]|uniref:hypothetical protein n=1 Tax=Photobacterium frigidiphilum TaxID=264736 RepID=UPI0030025597
MNKLIALVLLAVSCTATAANLTNSYINGSRKVCVYDDSSTVSVGITEMCPYMKL